MNQPNNSSWVRKNHCAKCTKAPSMKLCHWWKPFLCHDQVRRSPLSKSRSHLFNIIQMCHHVQWVMVALLSSVGGSPYIHRLDWILFSKWFRANPWCRELIVIAVCSVYSLFLEKCASVSIVCEFVCMTLCGCRCLKGETWRASHPKNAEFELHYSLCELLKNLTGSNEVMVLGVMSLSISWATGLWAMLSEGLWKLNGLV